MATKGDQIRNLVKAFGGTPRQSTIEDAIEDLVDLFTEKREVEMVEIVPEQSVTQGEGNVKITASIAPVTGKEYTVLVNGRKYKIEAKSVLNAPPVFVGIGNASFASPAENTGEPIFFMYTGTDFQVYWDTSLGETITLAIYEEQETVTPPVVNLGGGATFFSVGGDSDQNYLYNYDKATETLGKIATKEDVEKAMLKGVVYINEWPGGDCNIMPVSKFQPHAGGMRVYFDGDDHRDTVEIGNSGGVS